MNAAEVVEAERERRAEVRQACLDVIERGAPHEAITLAQLVRHIETYYGKTIARSATVAELVSGAAEAGACPTSSWLWNVRLIKPSRAAMLRIAAKWNAQIPDADIPMIRRPHAPIGGETIDPGDVPRPGAVFKSHGVYRQFPDPESSIAWRDGGDNRHGSTSRRRRFPGYIARIRAYLDKEPTIAATDRVILEFIVEGKTLRWIADEIGMKTSTVHKRVAQLRDKAGIPGPGAGR